jgi:hypothetical protein
MSIPERSMKMWKRAQSYRDLPLRRAGYEKSDLRFRKPLRILKLFPDAYAGGGVGGVGGFFSRCGARST